ncbi:T9SS type A sorting domain-containing protein [bacterium]|nr:T9SS type A sorting domain-containing protein [bacterium]
MKAWRCFFVFAVLPQVAIAQPPTIWERAYGGSEVEEGKTIEQTVDGAFIVGGFTYSFGSGGTDMWLLRLSANGDSLWSRTFGGEGNEFCSGLAVMPDGYLLCGATTSFGVGGEDILLVKVSSDGDSLWSRTYGRAGNDLSNVILSTPEGGFLLGTEGVMSILKIDANGDSLWSLSLGGAIHTITSTADGNYVAAGYWGNGWPGDANMWMFKFTPDGDVLWTQTYADCGDQCHSVAETQAGFSLFGYSKIACGAEQYWVLKTDLSGDPIETHNYGGGSYDYCYGGFVGTDSGSMLAGYTWSFGSGLRDVWLVKTDSEGNMLWDQTYGGSDDDRAEEIRELPNRECIVVGSTSSYGSGNSDVYVIRLGQDDSILPVELLDFEALPGDQQVILRWSTASESNLEYFAISRDGVNMAQIRAFNSALGHEYAWLDHSVASGQTYLYTLASTDFDGHTDVLATASARLPDPSVASDYLLGQNFPNPFNASTNITFSIPDANFATLKVYNLLGQEVATLFEGWQPTGKQTVTFDASDASSGVYLYELSSGKSSMSRRMILLR